MFKRSSKEGGATLISGHGMTKFKEYVQIIYQHVRNTMLSVNYSSSRALPVLEGVLDDAFLSRMIHLCHGEQQDDDFRLMDNSREEAESRIVAMNSALSLSFADKEHAIYQGLQSRNMLPESSLFCVSAMMSEALLAAREVSGDHKLILGVVQDIAKSAHLFNHVIDEAYSKAVNQGLVVPENPDESSGENAPDEKEMPTGTPSEVPVQPANEIPLEIQQKLMQAISVLTTTNSEKSANLEQITQALQGVFHQVKNENKEVDLEFSPEKSIEAALKIKDKVKSEVDVDVDDESVIDYVSNLFGQILSKANLSPVVQMLASSMQQSVMQLAMADYNLLRKNEQHPAKEFINLVCKLGFEVSNEKNVKGNPLYQLLSSAVAKFNARVNQELSIDQMPNALNDAAKKLKDKLSKKREQELNQNRIADREDMLGRKAMSAIKTMDRYLKLPKNILTVMKALWLPIMVRDGMRHGAGSKQWKQDMKWLELMAKSVRIKQPADQLEKRNPQLIAFFTRKMQAARIDQTKIDRATNALTHFQSVHINELKERPNAVSATVIDNADVTEQLIEKMKDDSAFREKNLQAFQKLAQQIRAMPDGDTPVEYKDESGARYRMRVVMHLRASDLYLLKTQDGSTEFRWTTEQFAEKITNKQVVVIPPPGNSVFSDGIKELVSELQSA